MLIGCDPEFVYFNLQTNKFIPAHNLTEGSSSLGCDGHSETAELRPSPQETAKKVVSQIFTLFEEAETYDNMQKVGMLAGHFKFNKTIGGHIHISGFKMDMAQLGAILDSLFIPLSDIIDNLDERLKRLKGGYGKGYRQQKQNWIEYRTPGSWLLSPDIAFLNLGLAECIGKEYEYFNSTGDYSIFENVKKEYSISKKRNLLLNFIDKSTKFEDKDLLLNTASEIFSKTPINWDKNIKEYWL